jgi:hypothetical protein
MKNSLLCLFFCVLGKVSYCQNYPIEFSIKNCFKIECYKNSTLSKTGSGFVLFRFKDNYHLKDNYIGVTNEHVLDNVDSAILIFSDRTRIKVKGFVTSDHQLDACLFVFETNLSFIGLIKNYKTIRTSQYSVGEKIFTISSPKGLVNTFTDGVISAKRNFDTKELIQITAPISSGSSGGLLANQNGIPIGLLVSQFSQGQNLNFAIPISLILKTFLNKKIIDTSLNFIGNFNKIYELKKLDDYLNHNDPILSDIQNTLDDKTLTFEKLNKTDNEFLTATLLFLKYGKYSEKKLWNDAFNVLIYFAKKYDDILSDLIVCSFLEDFNNNNLTLQNLNTVTLDEMAEAENPYLRNGYNYLKGQSFYFEKKPSQSIYYLEMNEQFLKSYFDKIISGSNEIQKNEKNLAMYFITTYVRTYGGLSNLYINQDIEKSLNYLQTGLEISKTYKSTEKNINYFAKAIIHILLQLDRFKDACKVYKEYYPRLELNDINLIQKHCE